MLDSLVSDGYLKREDREPPFPGYPTPPPTYRITVLGLATLAAQESEQAGRLRYGPTFRSRERLVRRRSWL